MRRLVFLLIGLIALSLPSAALPAMSMHRAAHAMPLGHCGDETPCAQHVCLGCAIDPAEPRVPLPALALRAAEPQGRPRAPLPDHRPGFDPPPPRLTA